MAITDAHLMLKSLSARSEDPFHFFECEVENENYAGGWHLRSRVVTVGPPSINLFLVRQITLTFLLSTTTALFLFFLQSQ